MAAVNGLVQRGDGRVNPTLRHREHCQRRLDTKTRTADHRELRVRRVRPGHPAALSRRVAAGDVESLAHMVSLSDDIDNAIQQA